MFFGLCAIRCVLEAYQGEVSGLRYYAPGARWALTFLRYYEFQTRFKLPA